MRATNASWTTVRDDNSVASLFHTDNVPLLIRWCDVRDLGDSTDDGFMPLELWAVRLADYKQ